MDDGEHSRSDNVSVTPFAADVAAFVAPALSNLSPSGAPVDTPAHEAVVSRLHRSNSPGHAGWPRLAVAAGAVLVYLLLYPLVYSRVGFIVAALSLLPVIVVAGLLGQRAGVTTAVLLSLVNAVLLRLLSGADQRPTWYEDAASLVALMATAGATGRLPDLRAQLRARTAQREQAEARLRAERDFSTAVVETAGSLVVVLDRQGRIVRFNRACEAATGYAFAEVRGRLFWELFLPPGEMARVQHVFSELSAGHFPNTHTNHWIARDGTRRLIAWANTALCDDAGVPEYIIAMGTDITAARRAEEALRASEARSRALLEASPDYLLRLSRDGSVIDLHAPYWTATGARRDGDRQPGLSAVLPSSKLALLRRYIAATLDTGRMQVFEYQTISPAGRQDREARMVKLAADEVLCIVRDVTERKALEAQLVHQAFHDPLTGLPNRALFLDRLHHALARAARVTNPVAVLFLDLDRFKVINDSLGHEVGNQLLVAVAERLRGCLLPADTLARFGGDEFTILLENLPDAGDALRVAARLIEALRDSFTIGAHEVFVTASIGIVAGATRETTAEDRLRNAEVAMYRAKEHGRARYEIFDASMNAAALACFLLETDLHRALARGEFVVHYQPIADLATGRFAGLEALLRWQHPVHGLLSPAEFIPLAEANGLIVPLGRWVLQEACRQAQAWQRAYLLEPPLTISVNLSARQFQQPNLAVEVAAILRRTGLRPACLKLEITESVLMEDAEANIGTLQALKDLGVCLVIDDFGTGYSSLSYLKRFAVDTVKIDKAFVDGLGQNPGDAAIVQAVVTLAQALGLSVTAEGAETARQVDQLRALGCNFGQGYHFAKPLPSAEVETLLDHALPGSAALPAD